MSQVLAQPQNLSQRRDEIRKAASNCVIADGLWRDAAVLEFPGGERRKSRAVHWISDRRNKLIMDEFGAPAAQADDHFSSYGAPTKSGTKLYRLVNKNQLFKDGANMVHLSPASWTTRNPLESEIYQLFQEAKVGANPSMGAALGRLAAIGFLPPAVENLINLGTHLQDVKKKKRIFSSLDVELQELLVILDSDLGSAKDPLLVIADEYHPAQINHASCWRCYSPRELIGNVLNVFLPPAIFRGFDIYGRPISGREIQDRLKQYCVVSIDLANRTNCLSVSADYQDLLSRLDKYFQHAMKCSDPTVSFADNIPRLDAYQKTFTRTSYLFRVWSHFFSEVMIEGDHPIDETYEIRFTGSLERQICDFTIDDTPSWAPPAPIDSSDQLGHWFVPRYSA